MLGESISSKYEELLDILMDHKLTFENHLLNIVQKVNQKLYALARISKYMPQKKLRIIMKVFVSSQFAYTLFYKSIKLTSYLSSDV